MATFYVPPALVPAKAFPKLPPRVRIEAAIETLIEILDAADPDTDFEESGAEDSFAEHDDDGPGDPTADPDHGIDDLPHDDFGEAEPEEGIIPPIGTYGIDQREFAHWGGKGRAE